MDLLSIPLCAKCSLFVEQYMGDYKKIKKENEHLKQTIRELNEVVREIVALSEEDIENLKTT